MTGLCCFLHVFYIAFKLIIRFTLIVAEKSSQCLMPNFICTHIWSFPIVFSRFFKIFPDPGNCCKLICTGSRNYVSSNDLVGWSLENCLCAVFELVLSKARVNTKQISVSFLRRSFDDRIFNLRLYVPEFRTHVLIRCLLTQVCQKKLKY